MNEFQKIMTFYENNKNINFIAIDDNTTLVEYDYFTNYGTTKTTKILDNNIDFCVVLYRNNLL